MTFELNENIKSGPIISMANIKSSGFLSRIESLQANDMVMCKYPEINLERINNTLHELKHWVEIKQFDDGLELRLDGTCILSRQPDIKIDADCKCECHKKEKLAIFNLYELIRIMSSMKFTRVGDIYSWYYTHFYEQEPWDIQNIPRTPEAISKEMKGFEKKVLKDIRLNVQFTNYSS